MDILDDGEEFWQTSLAITNIEFMKKIGDNIYFGLITSRDSVTIKTTKDYEILGFSEDVNQSSNSGDGIYITELDSNTYLFNNTLLKLDTMECTKFYFETYSFVFMTKTPIGFIILVDGAYISMIDFVNFEYTILDSNIQLVYPTNEDGGDVPLYEQGYLSYNVNSGLNRVEKTLIFATGEIVTGEFTIPETTITNVKPLN